MSNRIMNNLALVIERDSAHEVVVRTEYNNAEVQAIQIEITENRLRIYHYEPGPDYASREAKLIIDLPVQELLGSLEFSDAGKDVPTKCRFEGCQEGNYCYGYHPAEYVTRDMAIDAGDRSLEGQLYREEEYEWGACPCCKGNFKDCRRCAEQDKGAKVSDIGKEG